jgi:hypothetical protein
MAGGLTRRPALLAALPAIAGPVTPYLHPVLRDPLDLPPTLRPEGQPASFMTPVVSTVAAGLALAGTTLPKGAGQQLGRSRKAAEEL